MLPSFFGSLALVFNSCIWWLVQIPNPCHLKIEAEESRVYQSHNKPGSGCLAPLALGVNCLSNMKIVNLDVNGALSTKSLTEQI